MQGGMEAGNNTNNIFAEIYAAVWELQNEDREGEGLNLQGIWKKKRDQKEGESRARAGLPDTLEGIFFFHGKLRNGVVSLLERTGCWGGGKVLKGAKWKALESSEEQWRKLLLFSKLFTSSLLFQHQQWPPIAAFTPPSPFLSLPSSAPSILFPLLFHFLSPNFPTTFASPSIDFSQYSSHIVPRHPPSSISKEFSLHVFAWCQRKQGIRSTSEVNIKGLDHYH